jgi:hypothetical protein
MMGVCKYECKNQMTYTLTPNLHKFGCWNRAQIFKEYYFWIYSPTYFLVSLSTLDGNGKDQCDWNHECLEIGH